MRKVKFGKGPAAQYESDNERIFEFSDGRGAGGLLSLQRTDEGVTVDLYRMEGGPVTVRVSNSAETRDEAEVLVRLTPAQVETLKAVFDSARYGRETYEAEVTTEHADQDALHAQERALEADIEAQIRAQSTPLA